MATMTEGDGTNKAVAKHKVKLTKTACDKADYFAKGGKLYSSGSAKRVIIWDTELDGFGLRIHPSNSKTFVYGYWHDGRWRLVDVGKFGKVTVDQARDEARLNLAKVAVSDFDPLQDKLDRRAAREAERIAQEAATLAARQALEAERQAQEARQRFTLRALCEAYADHLDRLGKARTATHCRSMTSVHLFKGDAALAATPAREVTQRQIATLIRTVRETGKERAAGILRAYLSAAFSLAQRAETDTAAPAALIPFGIDTNPVLGIRAIPVGRGQRTLTAAEIGAYVNLLQPGHLIDDFLRLHLLTAGQRASQLLRARVNDFDPATATLRLLDPKGRRTEAREHVLPLAPLAAALVNDLIARATDKARARAKETAAILDPNPPLFISTQGRPLDVSTPGKRVSEIATAMGGAAFDLRDLRRTVETQLAGMGITSDVRAQLLSHGLSGVQTAHYDRHDWLKQKTAALKRWEAHVTACATGKKGGTGNVVAIESRKTAAPQRANA
jgi:integrase